MTTSSILHSGPGAGRGGVRARWPGSGQNQTDAAGSAVADRHTSETGSAESRPTPKLRRAQRRRPSRAKTTSRSHRLLRKPCA